MRIIRKDYLSDSALKKHSVCLLYTFSEAFLCICILITLYLSILPFCVFAFLCICIPNYEFLYLFHHLHYINSAILNLFHCLIIPFQDS